MSLGIGEILTIIINAILFLGVPIVLVWMGYNLFRRISNLETRVSQLEAKQNKNPDAHS